MKQPPRENTDSRRTWSEYEQLVIFRLESLEKKAEEIQKELNELKLRSAMWGGVTGFLAAAIPLTIQIVALLW